MEIKNTVSMIDDQLGGSTKSRIQFNLIFADYEPIVWGKNVGKLSFGKYNSNLEKKRIFYKPYSKVFNLNGIEG